MPGMLEWSIAPDGAGAGVAVPWFMPGMLAWSMPPDCANAGPARLEASASAAHRATAGIRFCVLCRIVYSTTTALNMPASM